MEPFVVFVALPGTEERFTVRCAGRTVVGRSDECDIQLQHPLVSRRHVELERTDDGGIVVRDLNSSNGTVVQNSRLIDAEIVSPGDTTVHVGPYVLRVSTAVSTDSDTLVAEMPTATGRVAIDRNEHSACIDGETTIERISPHQFQLLELLAAAAPRTVPTQQLGDSLWGEDGWDAYMLHNLVRRVRRRMEEQYLPANELLITVQGVGYRLA